MKTVTVTYTDTDENLLLLATELGWTMFVTGDEMGGEEITNIPNPVTIDEFLTRWAFRILKIEITNPIKRKLDRETMATLNATKQMMEANLEDSITVSIE